MGSYGLRDASLFVGKRVSFRGLKMMIGKSTFHGDVRAGKLITRKEP